MSSTSSGDTSREINLFDTVPGGTVNLMDVAIILHPQDDVAVVKTPLTAGTTVMYNEAALATISTTIPVGHKIAIRGVAIGQPVRRYGQIIGFATADIAMGNHVHTHNLGVQSFDRDYAIGTDVTPVEVVPEEQRRTFMGFKRADGRVGTRNFIAVISSVNCSAHTSREIARYFTPEKLAQYPNVDGVIALTHSLGCGNRLGGLGYRVLQRTLAGFADHPNVAACVFVGLGCETNQVEAILNEYHLNQNGHNYGKGIPGYTIQDMGGIRKTIEAVIAKVEEFLPIANLSIRTPQPISELMVALQCGGSDGWSGVTANPLLGRAADEIVRQGGTVVLGETPEVYGAEHLLTRRAVSAEVAQKLIDKIHWWEHYTAINDMEIDNNPSVGNKLGGLTTILEKSLGAVAKGGTTPMTGVFDYAERVNVKGFTMMDTPGYDPVSATGQVAGGCNLVVFTTGRGSAFGFKTAPSIKVSTNTAIYQHMIDDMDFDGGTVLSGGDMQASADALLDQMIAVASGQPSKSEAQGVGVEEFNPWLIGATM